jgi:peroxiredoxin
MATMVRHASIDPRDAVVAACSGVSRRDVLCRALAGALAVSAFAPARVRAAAPASLAPDFTLKSLNGPNLRLAEQRGQIVMLNFWATWCAPCREEMPHLARLHEKYRASGFTVLGVNVDETQRQATVVATRLALPFPVLFDADKTVAKAYDVSTMPSSVFVDRDGRLRHVHKGYRSGDETVHEQLLRSLLKE